LEETGVYHECNSVGGNEIIIDHDLLTVPAKFICPFMNNLHSFFLSYIIVPVLLKLEAWDLERRMGFFSSRDEVSFKGLKR
jgi:hypothetical protein